MKKWWICGVAVLGLGGAAAMATPSYTAVFLPTDGMASTYAKGIASNGQIVGYSLDSGVGLVWTNPYSPPTLLNTPGYVSTLAYATDGTYQVGLGNTSTSGDAMLWNGSAQSAVDLSPSGYSLTQIQAIADGQEVGVGYQTINSAEHAMLWSGSAGSVADINPAGFQSSIALGTNGAQQVGSGTTTINGQPSGYRALLWNGSAASAVDITPAGYSEAQAFSISGNLVAGWGSSGTAQDALLWNLSNGTFTDLGPGFAYAVAGNYEAGYVGEDAYVWTGSANSAINLQNFLPSNYVYSVAYGVDANGDVIGAAGSYGQWQAVVWIAPEPTVISIAPVLVLFARRGRASR